MCCSWWRFCYRSLLAILAKKIGKHRKEIRNLNGFEYNTYLNGLKVPYYSTYPPLSMRVISMGITQRTLMAEAAQWVVTAVEDKHCFTQPIPSRAPKQLWSHASFQYAFREVHMRCAQRNWVWNWVFIRFSPPPIPFGDWEDDASRVGLGILESTL